MLISSTQKRWAEPPRDLKAEALLTREMRLHPITARLLVNRGLSEPDTADAFLRPDLKRLHDPFGLPDMDKAARRIADAISKSETLFVHGDYDVDGVTSTALYVRTLQALGKSPLPRPASQKRWL